MEYQYILVIICFITVILLNVFIVSYTIKRALKKYIIPKLQERGLLLESYKWVGLLKFGDFKNEKHVLRPSIGGGSPMISIYIYIYYKDLETRKRITVRIDTLFLFIRKVAYSTEI